MAVYGLNSTINFGKTHNGRTIAEVLRKDPDWLGWAEDTIDWFELDEEAEAALDQAIYEAIEWD